MNESISQPPGHGNLGLVLIGVFKLFKATILILTAVGALKLLHQDVAETVSEWIAAFRVDPDSRHLHGLIEKLGVVDDRLLKQISAGSFFYAALLLAEGIGLVLRRRWGEFLTVFITGSFIPLELYEVYRKLTWLRVLLLAVNLAILWYVVGVLRKGGKKPEVAATADSH